MERQYAHVDVDTGCGDVGWWGSRCGCSWEGWFWGRVAWEEVEKKMKMLRKEGGAGGEEEGCCVVLDGMGRDGSEMWTRRTGSG